MPSIEKTKFLFELVRVALNDKAYYIQTYDTPLGHRWLEALQDNLKQKRVLEKNFCFLGFADSNRDLNFLCRELNKSIEQNKTRGCRLEKKPRGFLENKTLGFV